MAGFREERRRPRYFRRAWPHVHGVNGENPQPQRIQELSARVKGRFAGFRVVQTYPRTEELRF